MCRGRSGKVQREHPGSRARRWTWAKPAVKVVGGVRRRTCGGSEAYGKAGERAAAPKTSPGGRAGWWGSSVTTRADTSAVEKWKSGLRRPEWSGVTTSKAMWTATTRKVQMSTLRQASNPRPFPVTTLTSSPNATACCLRDFIMLFLEPHPVKNRGRPWSAGPREEHRSPPDLIAFREDNRPRPRDGASFPRCPSDGTGGGWRAAFGLPSPAPPSPSQCPAWHPPFPMNFSGLLSKVTLHPGAQK